MNSSTIILAATDFSQAAANAVTYSAALAKSSRAKLILYNAARVCGHSQGLDLSSQVHESIIDDITKRLAVLAGELSQLYNIEVSFLCSFTSVNENLLEIIQERKVDLIVMGLPQSAAGQTGSSNSTAAFLKQLQLPVLAVPPEARFYNAGKILYACDSLSLSSLKKFSWLRRVVGDLGAEIELFSVDEKLAALKEQQQPEPEGGIHTESGAQARFTEDSSLKTSIVLKEIEKEITFYGADILVIVPERNGFWDSADNRAKARAMAAQRNVPLLTYSSIN